MHMYSQLLGLSDLVPLERCRLVKFDDYSENLDESFDDSVVSSKFKKVKVHSLIPSNSP